MIETTQQRAHANPGHVVTTTIGDLANIWKFGGYETRTDEDWARVRRRNEIMVPSYKRAVGEMADRLAEMVTPEGREIADRIQADVAEMGRTLARRRDEWLLPQLEAIQALRESGRDVWLEESPIEFETVGDDPDSHTYRASRTARIRYTGDGLDAAT